MIARERDLLGPGAVDNGDVIQVQRLLLHSRLAQDGPQAGPVSETVRVAAQELEQFALGRIRGRGHRRRRRLASGPHSALRERRWVCAVRRDFVRRAVSFGLQAAVSQNFVLRTVVPLGARRSGRARRRDGVVEVGIVLCEGERVGVSVGDDHVMWLLSEYGEGDLQLS